jgi:hypothetical protein
VETADGTVTIGGDVGLGSWSCKNLRRDGGNETVWVPRLCQAHGIETISDPITYTRIATIRRPGPIMFMTRMRL